MQQSESKIALLIGVSEYAGLGNLPGTQDDVGAIEQWITRGMIGKPSGSQIDMWDHDRSKKFSMLVISPYVLIQERCPTYH